MLANVSQCQPIRKHGQIPQIMDVGQCPPMLVNVGQQVSFALEISTGQVDGWGKPISMSELARLSARLDQIEAENLGLRRDVAELKCEVGYWKSRHADTLQRIQERDLRIEQRQAEIKQLKSRQFGRKTEKSSGGST